MSNDTPLISIIIPIYNVEDYLRKTLDSVLAQSYQNLEILCVLDSPTDNSERIAIEYQQRDSRIRLIHQDNQGVSVARNNGMDQAKGDYFFFLDSDDWLINNAIELLVEAALRTKCLVISGGIINVDETTQTQSVYNRKRKTGHLTLTGKHFFDLEVVVWNKLYHRSTCEDIRYVPGLIHQDEEFYWQFFARNQNAYAIEEDVIYYYRRGNSITTTKRKTNEKYQLNYLTVIKNAYNLLSSRPDLKYQFRKRAIKYLRKIQTKNAPYSIYQEHIAKEYGLRDDFFTKLKTDLIKLTC
ncbi:glycosyltransferase family 2 protein [Vibrio atypicus]|uniref:glycosyltransferase family 2 protein n=1 Tax=Vibrio atypicus TaxID=558271 RepID=UPI00373555E3